MDVKKMYTNQSSVHFLRALLVEKGYDSVHLPNEMHMNVLIKFSFRPRLSIIIQWHVTKNGVTEGIGTRVIDGALW